MGLVRRVLAVGLVLAGTLSCAEPESASGVLLFVIDTLRADALGTYGSSRGASPNLDAFGRGGMVFERALAPAPQTAPSHATLFTSTPPATHGVWNELTVGGKDVHPQLADEAVTLAEVFRDAGWATAAFTDGGWLIRWRGFDQGFQRFDARYAGVGDRMDAALAWLRERDPGRPFFLFLHTYEVHAPYVPPPKYEEAFAQGHEGWLRRLVEEIRAVERTGRDLGELGEMLLDPVRESPRPQDVRLLRALYHAELAHVDEQFARLLEDLEALGLRDSTLVMVTSDHGEEFGEHGMFAHEQVYEPLLRIPLLARGPGVPAGVRRSDPAELADLMPSLLRYAGLPVPAAAVGRDLDLRSEHAPSAPSSVSVAESVRLPQAAVRRGTLKAVLHTGDPARAEVYDLEADPAESRDLSDTEPGSAWIAEARRILATHREEARRHRDRHGLRPALPGSGSLGETEQQALRALGYLEEEEVP